MSQPDIKVGDTLAVMLDKHSYVIDDPQYMRRTVRLQVIARRKYISILYVPHGERVANAKKLTEPVRVALQLNTTWLGDYIVAVDDSCVINIIKFSDGHYCLKCKQFFPYVKINISSGVYGYTCYECRNYPRD